MYLPPGPLRPLNSAKMRHAIVKNLNSSARMCKNTPSNCRERVIYVLLNLIKSCVLLPNSCHVFTRFHHGAGYPFFLFGTHHLHFKTLRANILKQSIQLEVRTSTEVEKYVVFRRGVPQIMDGFGS